MLSFALAISLGCEFDVTQDVIPGYRRGLAAGLVKIGISQV